MTNNDEDIMQFFRVEFPVAISEGKINTHLLKAFVGQDNPFEDSYFFHWEDDKKVQSVIQTPPVSALSLKSPNSASRLCSENIFIEGDTLETLKLIKRSYHEKIKLILFNPPQNNRKDFIFSDSTKNIFENYQEQLDNPRSYGKSTSNWLSFIYPRLFYAYSLLRPDGLFFVIVSESELHHMRILADILFTERNYMGTSIWAADSDHKSKEFSENRVTYILIYAKNRKFFVKNRSYFKLPDSIKSFSNPDNDPRGPWKADPFQAGGERKKSQYYPIKNPNTGKIFYPNPGNCWKNSEVKFYELLEDNRIIFGRTGRGGPQRKRFWKDAKRRGRTPKTLWNDLLLTQQDDKDGGLPNDGDIVSNPLPVKIYERIIQLGTHEDDSIILDVFTGSGASAQAIGEINEKEGKNLKGILMESPITGKFSTEVENEDRYNSVHHGCRVFSQAKSQLAFPCDNHTDIEKIYEILLREGLSLNLNIEHLNCPLERYYRIENGLRPLIISFSNVISRPDVLRLDLTHNCKFFCYDSALSDSVKMNLGRLCELQIISEGYVKWK